MDGFGTVTSSFPSKEHPSLLLKLSMFSLNKKLTLADLNNSVQSFFLKLFGVQFSDIERHLIKIIQEMRRARPRTPPLNPPLLPIFQVSQDTNSAI
jgi:hypothetical protein